MNLVRAGHYFVGSSDPSPSAKVSDTDCNTATVVHVDEANNEVGLVWFDHDGHGPYMASAVDVDSSTHPQGGTFHLSADCPWKR